MIEKSAPKKTVSPGDKLKPKKVYQAEELGASRLGQVVEVIKVLPDGSVRIQKLNGGYAELPLSTFEGFK